MKYDYLVVGFDFVAHFISVRNKPLRRILRRNALYRFFYTRRDNGLIIVCANRFVYRLRVGFFYLKVYRIFHRHFLNIA